WKEIEVLDKQASIQFHFMRTPHHTNYYPTIFFQGKKVDLPNPSAYLICKHPAWMVLNGRLYGFEKYVDGKKLIPFFTKKHVVIPKNVEETYYNKFIAPLIASFDEVDAKGFEINKTNYDPHPVLTLSELHNVQTRKAPLFDGNGSNTLPDDDGSDESGKIVFDLSFKYGKHRFRGDNIGPVNVTMEKQGDDYVFHRITRKTNEEKNFLHTLQKLGLPAKGFRVAVPKSLAFSWLNENRVNLLNLGFEVSQPESRDKKYFVGKAVIEVEVKENLDWFDINAKIRFGEFEILFKDLRKLILRKKVEFKLPNGEIAIIPEAWLVKYADLFSLSETEGTNEKPVLRKHHLNLVKELEDGNLAKVHLSEKLRSLNSFSGIKTYPLPKGFN